MKRISIVFAAFVLTLSFQAYADGHGEKAGKKQFTECAAVRMKEINIKKIDAKDATTIVPEGWTVVSGTGGEGHPKLLICR